MLRVAAAGLLEAWKGSKGYDKVAMGNQVSNKRAPALKNLFYSTVTDLTKFPTLGVGTPSPSVPHPENRLVAAALNVGTGVCKQVENHNAGLPCPPSSFLSFPLRLSRASLDRRGSSNFNDRVFPACWITCFEILAIFDIPASTILPSTLNRHGPGLPSKLFLRETLCPALVSAKMGIRRSV